MRCKNCKEKFEPIRFNQKYCLKDECLRVFVAETKEKQWKQTKTRMKAELETVQDLVKAAQLVFNKYIRERDKDELCISCKQKPKKVNAGHFWNANNHWNVRFDEDNVHVQCERCNSYLSGNLLEYRTNLLIKIGAERFNQLEARARVTRKFTKDELKELIKKYKEKHKQLE
jgi:vacuolar-type H+-ATPase catalytic subunit A/Vma1